jgi:catechol 2,3-dioxygenase-like lactoylglutathione lyase family enzyme
VPTPLALNGVHHIALTVTDVPRAREFYSKMLGFNLLMELGPKTIMGNGGTILALNLAYDAAQVPPNDRFTENRAGLDHVSFGVASRADLEAAVQTFDENNVSHGEINDLGHAGLPIYVLAFRDPDNIQLELTAPHG